MEIVQRLAMASVGLAIGIAGCDSPATEPAAAPQGSHAADSPAPTPASGGTSDGSKTTTSVRTEPRKGEVVYYGLHPNWKKVDQYCGARDRAYIVRHVMVPKGDPAVLTRAVEALADSWRGPASRIREVTVSDGMAIIDLRSMRELGTAGTSCGGVSFMGSLTRTVFQFESIDSFQVHLAGSCRDFGDFMQAARCITATRDDA